MRVYVAGAYDAPNVCRVLGNMRRGNAVAVELLQAGYAPFSPWLDFQFGLQEDIPRDDYLEYSLAWLEASQAVVCVPEGIKESAGSQAEIARARALGIPVYDSLGSFLAAQAVE